MTACVAATCVRARHVQFRHKPGPEPAEREIERFLLRLQIRPGDHEPLLKAAQLQIIASDFREQRREYVAPVFDTRGQVRRRGFDAAPDAAEDVDLPRGIKADLVKLGLRSRQAPFTERRLRAALCGHERLAAAGAATRSAAGLCFHSGRGGTV